MARMNGAVERIVRLPAERTREAMTAATATYYGNAEKARRELDWTPRPLNEGFEDTFVTA